ncbi:MAG: hypothetical protein JNJ64_08420 [Flavobacteriales bacterium]|nr:hypothetical protein [Flavobacteriales bacterium]
MALSNLQAGNSKGVDTTIRFKESPDNSTFSINGLVSGSGTNVQFTVYLDPDSFTCQLSADRTQVLITIIAVNRNPKNVVYTVDTGVELKTAKADSTALVMQLIPVGQSNGTVYTFTKSTGGGGAALKRPRKTPGRA